MGINGLYVNLRGREKNGTVEPRDRRALMDEIAAKLLATVDPATGQPALTKVYAREDVYQDTGSIEIGPDLQMGYAKGTAARARARSATSRRKSSATTSTTGPATTSWTTSRCRACCSPAASWRSRRPASKSLASALLAELGVEGGFPRGARRSTG